MVMEAPRKNFPTVTSLCSTLVDGAHAIHARAPATTAGAPTTSASSSAASRGHSVDEAAKALGQSRQSVYALRRRPGAEEFARAWDAALLLGREGREAQRCSPGVELEYGLETVLAAASSASSSARTIAPRSPCSPKLTVRSRERGSCRS
jgi:hypothetical protein